MGASDDGWGFGQRFTLLCEQADLLPDLKSHLHLVAFFNCKQCVCACVRVRACVCVLVTQSCLTLRDPMRCSLPGSSIRGIMNLKLSSEMYTLSETRLSQ